jgi:GNAT superfamily N-acetyltransferase
MDVSVRELTPALLPRWLAFFDGPAFADNPDWGSCYCRCFRFDGGLDAWDAACASGENRREMSAAIAAGRVSGALAFDGEAPVGWVQFGSRTDFRHPAIAACPVDDADAVGSIVCFVVAATHRRRGVAGALLRAACDALARRGLSIAEAYPDRDGAEHRFMCGPLEMYAAEGFAAFRELPKRVVLRKRLAP